MTDFVSIIVYVRICDVSFQLKTKHLNLPSKIRTIPSWNKYSNELPMDPQDRHLSCPSVRNRDL